MTPPTGTARVGCSGWSYKDWRGVVYPADLPASRWFAYYAEHFDTVELNTTFYRLPDASTVEGWCAAAPDDFCFALKVGQYATHRKKLIDPVPWMEKHLDRARRLDGHLGPNLFQLPPRWKRNAARLDEALAAAPSDIKWAVELRDPSWLHDDVFDVLAARGAALCIHDLLADHPWIRTTDWTYVRFHGPRALEEPYHGRYGAELLDPIADRLTAWMDEGADVFAYFNNDWHGNAWVDATHLRGTLGDPASG
jgi:uncharacterized protein YecE (DUF72 family)